MLLFHTTLCVREKERETNTKFIYICTRDKKLSLRQHKSRLENVSRFNGGIIEINIIKSNKKQYQS